MSTEKVILHTMKGAWGMPSASPFCAKLETWLRMAEVPYEAVVLAGPPKSKTGKAPYIEYQGELVDDSGTIIERLTEMFDVQLDVGLTDEERAHAHVVRRTIEESLYFVALHERWMRSHWPEVKQVYFGDLPPVVRSFVPEIIKRSVAKAAHGQGIARKDVGRIDAHGAADVRAIATMLGDGQFMFGRPSSIDAVLFGFLGAAYYADLEGPLRAEIAKHAHVVSYLDGMKTRYWSDLEG